MQIVKNKKGAVLLDVMFAIIFFAIVSIGIFKLLFSDKTSTTGSVTTVEQLDITTQKIDYINQMVEWVKVNVDRTNNTLPACDPQSQSNGCPSAPQGIVLKNAPAVVDVDSHKVTFTITVDSKDETITIYY